MNFHVHIGNPVLAFAVLVAAGVTVEFSSFGILWVFDWLRHRGEDR